MTRAVYAETEAAWPGLRAEAGLAQDGWRAERVSARDDARVRRAVVAYARGETRLVVKRTLAPADPKAWLDRVAAHAAASEAFGAPPGLAIPAILAVDAGRQAVLMTHAPGVPLAVALDGQDMPAQAALMRRAGAWLSAFHACQLDEQRLFQPKYTLTYLRQVMERVASGAQEVAQAPQFLRWAELLIEMGGRFQGQMTASCATHGDLHLRNIMLSEACVTGLDFGPRGMAPVGHDIGRLLVDYTLVGAARLPDPGDVVPGEVLAAFFQGYTLVGADDPSVGLMLRMRLLAEWIALPPRGRDRSASQARRFQALRGIIPPVMQAG